MEDIKNLSQIKPLNVLPQKNTTADDVIKLSERINKDAAIYTYHLAMDKLAPAYSKPTYFTTVVCSLILAIYLFKKKRLKS